MPQATAKLAVDLACRRNRDLAVLRVKHPPAAHLQRVGARLRHHRITELGGEQQAAAPQAGRRDDLPGEATAGSRARWVRRRS